MKFGLPVIGVLMLLAQLPVWASGEQDYGLWLTDATKVVIGNVKESLYLHLTADERRIVRSIHFRLSPSRNVNAYAYKRDGQRIVRIDTGYLAVIDQLSLAYVVEHELGHRGCYEEFARAALRTISENTEDIRRRRSARTALESVWTRGQDRESACHGATRREFDRHPKAGRYYAGGVEGALSFMILHEIAHHVLGHVDMSRDSMTLERSRGNETKADQWAFERGIGIQVNPLAGLASWVFFSALDGADLSDESRSTHPLTLRRFRRMLETVLVRGDGEDYEATFGAPLDKDVAGMIRNGLDQLDSVLHVDG